MNDNTAATNLIMELTSKYAVNPIGEKTDADKPDTTDTENNNAEGQNSPAENKKEDDVDTIVETFIMSAVNFGLTGKQIETIFARPNSGNLYRYILLICLTLGISKDLLPEPDAVRTPEKLRAFFYDYYLPKQDQNYERLMQYILDDDMLSSQQVYQLTKAVQLKVPQTELLKLAASHKTAAEIGRAVEFYEITHREKLEKETQNIEKRKRGKENVRGNTNNDATSRITHPWGERHGEGHSICCKRREKGN